MEKLPTIEVSVCCSGILQEGSKDHSTDHHDHVEIHVCSICGKECEIKEVCEMCLGTGQISVDVGDGEGHIMRGVGTEICLCQKQSKYEYEYEADYDESNDPDA